MEMLILSEMHEWMKGLTSSSFTPGIGGTREGGCLLGSEDRGVTKPSPTWSQRLPQTYSPSGIPISRPRPGPARLFLPVHWTFCLLKIFGGASQGQGQLCPSSAEGWGPIGARGMLVE